MVMENSGAVLEMEHFMSFFEGSDMDDLFENLFGHGFHAGGFQSDGTRRQFRKKGQDVRAQVEITFEKPYLDVKRLFHFRIRRQE